MRALITCALLVGVNLSCSKQRPVNLDIPSQPRLGMNLSGITFWTPEVVFVDVFKQSQPWTSQAPGKPYNQGGPLAVNDRGWVEKLNGNGHLAESLMFEGLEGHYPDGNYICLYDGEGTIDFAQAGKVIERKPGRLVVQVTPKKGAIALRLTATDAQNPVRNIRLLLPGFESSYKEQPFYPPFLKHWDAFKVLRFMDWQATNNSRITSWSERTTPEHSTQARERKGVAVEYQIQLANAQKADPWFTIPHRANDQYVREFAKLVKASLDADRKIYLEYSNECWHTLFEGGRYCAERGRALGLSGNDYEAQLRFYSQRSVEIFKIASEVLGKERLVRVLTTPPDSAWAVGTVLDWNEAINNVDAIAIAPYFGGDLGKAAQAETTAALSVEQLLDACVSAIDTQGKKTAELAKVVRDRGLKLLAYEGGQHLVGAEGAENNEKLTALFIAANRDPRMKELYLRDLRHWQEARGYLFCIFGSMGRSTKWGSWGVLEYFDQDEKSAPKLQAIREFMRE